MHIFLQGTDENERTALMQRLARGIPLYGFHTTEQARGKGDEVRVYMHHATGRRSCTRENLIGIRAREITVSCLQTLGHMAEKLLTGIPAGSVVVMNQLDFMCTQSPAFRSAAQHILDGGNTVLATGGECKTKFHQELFQREDMYVYPIEKGTRQSVYEAIIADMMCHAPESPLLHSYYERMLQTGGRNIV